MNTYRYRYSIKPIESLSPGRNWYEVVDVVNVYHLWIVEHNPTSDSLACTCEARERCEHMSAVGGEVLAADYQAEQADAIARQHGQY